jgi:ssDNA-binding Zn-finger/Zn-ribbon topoisomerase 1
MSNNDIEMNNKIESLKCPDCGSEMIPRSSQYGKFWGCSDYPQCKGTRDSMGMSKAEREKERAERYEAYEYEDLGPDPFAGEG